MPTTDPTDTGPRPFSQALYDLAHSAIQAGGDEQAITDKFMRTMRYLSKYRGVGKQADSALAAGADPAEMSSTLWHHVQATENAARPEPENLEEKIADPLRAAYQGATFGLGNKLTAATRAVLPESMGGTKGFDYSGALEDERKALTRYQGEHPYQSGAANVVGGVLPALATLGVSAPATLGNAVKTGAAYGGMAGAGEPDSPTIEDALASTGRGAVAGAVVGGVVHGATRAPGAILDYAGIRPSRGGGALSRAAQLFGVKTAEERAPEMLLSRLDRGNLAPADVSKTAAEAQDLGKPATMIEAGGKPMVRLARGAQGVPSKGATEIQSMLESRRAGAPARVATDVETGMGAQRQNVYELADKLAEEQRAKAAPLYKNALAVGPVPLETSVPGTNLTLSDLLKRPSSQKALAYEGQLAKEEGRSPLPDLSKGGAASELTAKMSPEAQARFAEMAKAQGIDLGGSVGMEQLHNLKLRLDETLGYARAHGSLPDGTAATNKMLRAIQDTKNQLLSVMDTHSPQYGEARRVWAGDAELQDALESGRNFLKQDARQTARDVADLSEAGKGQFRVGAVDAIRQTIDRAQDGADVTRKIFGNELQRSKLRAAFPSDEAFSRFQRQMQMEGHMAKNENTILGNSQTAEKQSDIADVAGGAPHGHMMSMRGIANTLLRSKMASRVSGLAESNVNALAPYLTAGSGRPGAMTLEGAIGALNNATRRNAPRLRAGGPTRALIGSTSGREAASP